VLFTDAGETMLNTGDCAAGVAPEQIIATHYVNNTPASGVQFQRPLCPFPQVARYTVGDPTNADSFKCVQDEPDRDPRDQSR
jgi:hypothetical protein